MSNPFTPFSEFDQDDKFPHKSSGKIINDEDVSADILAAALAAEAAAVTATTQAGIAVAAIDTVDAASAAAVAASEDAAIAKTDSEDAADIAQAAAVAAAASAAEAAATVLGDIPEDTVMGRNTSGTGPIQYLPFTAVMRTLAAAITQAAQRTALGFSELGSSLATAADNAAARTVLGLGSLAMLSSITAALLPTGVAIQYRQSTYTTRLTTTTALPHDTTTPQISEGTQILSDSITLADSSNKVLISVDVPYRVASGAIASVAVFASDGSTTVCIGAKPMGSGGAATVDTGCVHFEKLDIPGSIGPWTFSVRVGCHTGTGDLQVNSNGSGQLFNGLCYASMTLTEIKA